MFHSRYAMHCICLELNKDAILLPGVTWMAEMKTPVRMTTALTGDRQTVAMRKTRFPFVGVSK